VFLKHAESPAEALFSLRPKKQKTRRRKARRVFVFGLALAEFLTRPQSVEIKSAQPTAKK
jgi:hypothetical protein